MSTNGRLALNLVDDFLENLELRYTSTVFRSESGFKPDRTSIEMRNTLDLDMDFKRPVLLQLLDKINPINELGGNISTQVSEEPTDASNKDSIEVDVNKSSEGSKEIIEATSNRNSL